MLLRFVLACTLLSIAQTALLNDGTDRPRYVLVADPVQIFGIDLLGWGVDLRVGEPENSLRVPFYNWAWTDKLTYTYPLEPATKFVLPDDVYARTVNQIYSTQRRYESFQNYLSSLELSAGLGLQGSRGSAPSSNTTANSGSGTPSMASFAGDVNVQYTKRQMTEYKALTLLSTMECSLYQLFLGPQLPPRGSITEAVNNARSRAALGTKWAYAEFIARHGTHFIETVTVGGYLEMESIVSSSGDNDTTSLAVKAGFAMKNAFGIDDAKLTLDVQFKDDVKKFEVSTSHQLKAMGGDVKLVDFFSSSIYKDTGKTFEDWHVSLIRNAVPIRYRLREVCWFFDDDRDKCHKEFLTYMQGGTPY